jgi:hypothetical protein
LPKEIILYNLAGHVTDDEYRDYVIKEKGPFLESLSSVKKFELFKITGTTSGEIPFKYIGIIHLNNLEEFYKNDAPSQKFRDFMDKWQSMVSNFHILLGEEIY